jgi:hypothetical protein
MWGRSLGGGAHCVNLPYNISATKMKGATECRTRDSVNKHVLVITSPQKLLLRTAELYLLAARGWSNTSNKGWSSKFIPVENRCQRAGLPIEPAPTVALTEDHASIITVEQHIGPRCHSNNRQDTRHHQDAQP